MSAKGTRATGCPLSFLETYVCDRTNRCRRARRCRYILCPDNLLTAVVKRWPEPCVLRGNKQCGRQTMGTRDTGIDMKARPILNERDYQNAKSLLAKEMHNTHSDRVWARLEALMQAVA